MFFFFNGFHHRGVDQTNKDGRSDTLTQNNGWLLMNVFRRYHLFAQTAPLNSKPKLYKKTGDLREKKEF